jgi:hypothetical protein
MLSTPFFHAIRRTTFSSVLIVRVANVSKEKVKAANLKQPERKSVTIAAWSTSLTQKFNEANFEKQQE